MNSYESQRPRSDFDIHKTGTRVFHIKSKFPYAFVPIQEDGSMPGYGKIVHVDGAGSKPIVSYLVWKETGNEEIFQGLADDIIAMNLDDMYCAGLVSDIEFVDYVAINRFNIPKELFLNALNSGLQKAFGILRDYGIPVSFLGGETSEASDQVRTVDVSATARARIKLEGVITGEHIQEGDVIVGLGSFGKAAWEEKENSGIMCNGLTVARHSLIRPSYEEQYPEIAEPATMEYKGRFAITQYMKEVETTLGEALTSPTRIFAPVLKRILEKYGVKYIHGIIHNTGGGLTKCLRVGKDIHWVKDNLLPLPPIFSLIQRESKRPWRSIFEGLNNGIGMEIITSKQAAEAIIEDAEQFNIPAAVIGHCEKNAHGNRLTISSEHGTFDYPYETVE